MSSPISSSTWQPGLAFHWGRSRHRVMSVVGDQVEVFCDPLGDSQLIDAAYLVSEALRGKIKFDELVAKKARTPATRQEERLQQAQRRFNYVSAYREATTKKMDRRVMREVIDRVALSIDDENKPSIYAVYGWARRFNSHGESLDALVDRFDRCGNRKQLKEEAVQLIEAVIQDHYLNNRGVSLAKANAFLEREYHRRNSERGLDFEKPSYAALCRYVRKTLDPFHLLERRFGRAHAMREYRGRGQGAVSWYPMQRVEIDHTTLDVMVVDDRGVPIQRPTLTIAIDHYSRCVVGYRLGLEKPSAVPVLEVLSQIMTDKTPLLATLKGCEGLQWRMSGLPTELICDNGAEFGSEAFRQACQDMGVLIQFCPPGVPWYKGSVERIFGTLNTQLVHSLPGTTFSNTRQRADYKSEELACLTIDEVDAYIRRWIVASYHEEVHGTLGKTPRQAWEIGVAEKPVRRPPTGQSAMLVQSHAYRSSISGGAVRFDGRRYHSAELVTLAAKMGKSKQVEVRCPFADISAAFVRDTIAGRWLKVPCVSPGVTQGMSRSTYMLLKKVGRRVPAAPGFEVVAAQQALDEDAQRDHRKAVAAAEKKRREKSRAKRTSGRAEAKQDEQSVARQAGLNRQEAYRLKLARMPAAPPEEDLKEPITERIDDGNDEAYDVFYLETLK